MSTTLTADGIRYDRFTADSFLGASIEAAAESTRYVVTVAQLQRGWLVAVPNFEWCMELPNLRGWHYSYFTRKIRNERSAMALVLILDELADRLGVES